MIQRALRVVRSAQQVTQSFPFLAPPAVHIRVACECETSCTGSNDSVEMQFTISDLSPVFNLRLAIKDYELGFVVFYLAGQVLDSLRSDVFELNLAIFESFVV